MSDTPPVDSPKRFRVAFSFAGEKRAFVAKVAAILARRFGKRTILYDKFHEAEFARARLGRYLPKLYHDESDLVVVVFCLDYGQKEWCGLEWDAIFDLLKKHREADVMLCRFNAATVEGLFSDAGYSELDHKTPAEVATLILERLALNEHKKALSSPDVAVPTLSFPSTPPTISWPLADGLAVRRAVEGVLCAESKHRIVLVQGESGRGKTQACKILGRLGSELEWLRCGLLDVKGGSGLALAVGNFITDLRAEELLPVSSGGALDRVAGLIAALDRAPQPTLLIFDTFENGGEFSRWVEERVLPEVKQREWLRVVVAGQMVPTFSAAIYDLEELPPVTLEQILVDDWVEFGRRRKKDLPRHEVETVYKLEGNNHQLMQGYVLKLCKP
jgi:hypothetical protein